MKNVVRFGAFALAVTFMASCAQPPKGEKTELTDAKKVDSTAAAASKEVAVDAGASVINWVGTKITGKHEGTLKVKSGKVNVKEGKVVGGSFVIDMTSINVTDLDEKSGKGKLEGHLKDKDFFAADKFPEGKFEITAVKEQAGKDGMTHEVEGNLTLRDQTKGIKFPAKITVGADGAVNASTVQFLVDRQQFGIAYTGKKDDLISDQMGIRITLVAK